MNKVFAEALKEFGQRGIVGAKHNARILKYFRAPGFKQIKDDETAWCAAFVNYCFWACGLVGSGSLMARSFLKVGKGTKAPQLGDLVVLWRIRPLSAFGHVGFFVTETETSVFILGGNQSNSVNIAEFPKSQVLEYRTFSDKK